MGKIVIYEMTKIVKIASSNLFSFISRMNISQGSEKNVTCVYAARTFPQQNLYFFRHLDRFSNGFRTGAATGAWIEIFVYVIDFYSTVIEMFVPGWRMCIEWKRLLKHFLYGSCNSKSFLIIYCHISYN